ncbi:ATP-binding protein [Paractinoplanes atraurantiacus]|uniref:ATP-binding protein n=1 Tax=Paractinoplanes atraurantiacus TaxID=1036182 RepID=UPI0031830FF7
MSGPREKLVAQLASIKELSGLSLRALARRAELSSSSLSRYLTGQLVPPWEAVVALCRVAGRDPRPLRTLWTAAGETEAAPPPRRNDLPADLFDFTGREAEAAQVEELLRTAGTVAVDGMAGVGKTSLAVHVAHRLAAKFPDGALYLDLQGFTPGQEPVDSQTALVRLLDALDIAHVPADAAALWRSELSRRRALVVLDNAVDADQVRPLLPGAGRSAVLITSRNRLISLDGVPPVSLPPLSDEAAADLFERAAGLSVSIGGGSGSSGSGGSGGGRDGGGSGGGRDGGGSGGGRDGGGAEGDAVGQVLAQCGGLPLALRMAGARLRHRPGWTVAVLAERLRDTANRFDAAFGMSLRQLDDNQRRLFRLLGVLPGTDFDAAAAGALIGRPTDAALEELVDAHLVQEVRPGRYRMHDLIRQYAADLAAAEPGADAAVMRVLVHYLNQAEEQDLQWLDLEYVNLVACFDAAVRLAADEIVVGLPQALRPWFFRHRGTDDQIRMLAAAAEAAGRLGRDEQRAALLSDLGWAHAAAGRPAEALAAYEEATPIIEALAASEAVTPGGEGLGASGAAAVRYQGVAAGLALRRGLVHRDLEDFEAAQADFRQARALFGKAGNRSGLSQALAFDAWVTLRLGRPEEAAELARSSIEGAEGPARITGLVTLGVASASELPVREALALAEQHDLRHNQAWCLNYLGVVLRMTGRFEEALDSHRRALELLAPLAEVQLERECRRCYAETETAYHQASSSSSRSSSDGR